MIKSLKLSLEELLEPDSPCLTDALGERTYEAIMMCFEHHGHESSLDSDVINLKREKLANAEIRWTGQNSKSNTVRISRIRRSFGEARNAVETAAEGFAHLIIPKLTGYHLMWRANIGEGVDYWLGSENDPDAYDFENAVARLEVSGTLRKRYLSSIEYIVNDKLEQTEDSDDSEVPALVLVVEFGRPIFYKEER